MYLTMWIKHGKKAKDGSYEYIVIPKCNEEEIKDYYRKSGIRVIRKFRLNTVREKEWYNRHCVFKG